MFRLDSDNDLMAAMHRLMWELEQALARGEQLNAEIVAALSSLKLTEDACDKEIEAILRNMLHEAENSDIN